ncbi:MAG: 2OG-Fe(II) oxygenase family protein [Sphingomonadaceae bacterium]
MEIRLNPVLDLPSLAASYKEANKLQIRDIFEEQTAENILVELQSLPWHLAYNEGMKVHELSPQQLRSLTAEQAARIRHTVDEGARAGYQFLYNHYPVFSRYFQKPRDNYKIFKVYEFLNSPEMLAFFRNLTGLDHIRWADCHATLYQAGHFLKFHTDENPKEQRLAAYVLNFTKGWGRDWGGLLQFWNKDYDVELAYRPIFNALNIFTIPADHSVSAIPSYVPGHRFSITGWLRADDPPYPIEL